MDKLMEFMKGRPRDKSKTLEDAVIEYVEQVEKTSVERYTELKK